MGLQLPNRRPLRSLGQVSLIDLANTLVHLEARPDNGRAFFVYNRSLRCFPFPLSKSLVRWIRTSTLSMRMLTTTSRTKRISIRVLVLFVVHGMNAMRRTTEEPWRPGVCDIVREKPKSGFGGHEVYRAHMHRAAIKSPNARELSYRRTQRGQTRQV